ncbi:PHD-finger family protein [Trichomonas vaginalis G3]|uniref:PHD-finger family protein n=1 Tax=Trichomonas vaginalis (strain ATCC PRA-98 / G3) TaxID=412133 RepID=A2GA66_TRIV3|nr:PHD-finger family protein [Trichomonas vaginalis G3]|eukprot:XP_001298879.1 PHD-finger family protein [Trichomonas vaginalis G3]
MQNEVKEPEQKIEEKPVEIDTTNQKESENDSIQENTVKINPITIPPRPFSTNSNYTPIPFTGYILPRPNSRIIPQLTEIGGNFVVQPNDPYMAKDPPAPYMYFDMNKTPYFIRCPCEQTHKNGVLVCCSKCNFYCHGACVGIARVTPDTNFICPYCQYLPLRCSCRKNMKFDEPIIKCVACGYYVHKSCAKLQFGRNPQNFVCQFCGSRQFKQPYFQIPEKSFSQDFTKTVPSNTEEIIKKIPEGDFRTMITEMLGSSELSYHKSITILFNQFGTNAFDYGHEFWKIFVSAISSIFEIPKLTVMETMDEIAVNFLYKPFPKHKLYSIPGLEISDSIRQNVMTEPLPKLPSMPSAANLGFTSHHTVCAMENIDDGAFICQIPGLLCHQDEIRAEEGIPRTCITIQGTPVAIDISQTTSKYALYIRRSFHFNCVVKLQIVNGNVCAMLYAARSRGPITDERSSSSGPAIMKGTELFLPFDSDLPYPIEKKAWKIKKTKPPTKTRPKPKQKQNNNTNNNQTKPPPTKNVAKGSERSQKNKNSHDQTNKILPSVKLTLLSSFMEDDLPPIPIVIQEEENEVDAKVLAQKRHSTHQIRNMSDAE